MVRAPGASDVAYKAAYGLPSPKRLDWARVNDVCRYMAEGYSKSAACGLAGLAYNVLVDWEDAFPAVREALGQGKLQRLAKLEGMLLADGQKMPQVVASIFALKNADPNEWKENPDKGQVAPGLQQNITIITGVPEAPAKQTIEHETAPALEQATAPAVEDIHADYSPAEQQSDT